MNWYQTFFIVGPEPASTMHGHFNFYLVFLSYVIATLASYVALDMSSHLKRENTNLFKFSWWVGGAIVMGAGIWSMHFIGMLAYHMDMPMGYDIKLTIISMVIAIITAGFAFLFFMIKKPKPIHYILSGLILGIAIPAMHYTGMEAMLNVDLKYRIGLFVTSILVAVLAAIAALWLSFISDKGSYTKKNLLKFVSALIMGIAICGMHYVGMAAAVMTPNMAYAVTGFETDPMMLSILIATIVISILCIALTLSVLRYYINSKSVSDKLFLEVVLNSWRGGVIAFNSDNKLKFFNNAAKKLFPGIDALQSSIQDLNKIIPLYKLENMIQLNDAEYPISQIMRGEDIKIKECIAIDHKGRPRVLAVDGCRLKGPECDNLGSIMVYQDITERKEIDQMKNEFISTVSHELRTPLTSIRGSLGLIMGGAMGAVPQKIRALLEIACNNSERLVRLINDILDTEKIESGKMIFHYNRSDLGKLIEQAVDANKSYADKYNVSYQITKLLPNVQVVMDSDRIRQVVDNLLSNAAKFSKSGGVISVFMEKREKNIRVSIADTGTGIPQEFQGKIFAKFYQADSSDNREKGGTGLGLSICKSIVEAHKGTIGFNSKQNIGTTFYFDLPMPDEQVETEEITVGTDTNKSKRILICEDDPDVGKLLGLILKERGFSSVRVTTVAEAKKILVTQEFGLMTLDLMLPDGYGLDLLQWMRAQPSLEKMPVVVISAVSIAEEKVKGSALGIVDWINKPINESRLYNDVIQALGLKSDTKTNKVLHVEDDPDIAEIVSKVIESICSTDVAPSIAAAKDLLEHTKYDLLILDLNLKDGAGYHLLSYLEEHGHIIPVVILSVDEIEQNVSKNIVASMVKSKVSNADILDKIISIINRNNKNTTG